MLGVLKGTRSRALDEDREPTTLRQGQSSAEEGATPQTGRKVAI